MNTVNTQEKRIIHIPDEAIKSVHLSPEMNEIVRLIFLMSANEVNKSDEEAYKMMVNQVCNEIKNLAHKYQVKTGYRRV